MIAKPIKFGSHKVVDPIKYLINSEGSVKFKDTDITLVKLTDCDEDFEDFKKIITNENVIFNSWFMANQFDMSAVRNYCETFELKINLTLVGDPDVSLPEETMKKVGRYSSNQLALDRFFSFEENSKALRELFIMMLNNSDKIELGYFVFSNGDKILGGGALTFFDSDNKKVNLAIHIIDQGKGIGDICLRKLLRVAFNQDNINEIWVKSAKNNLYIANFLGKHGMIIKSENEAEFYYIDKEIFSSLRT